MIGRQFQIKINILRSDNGTEYFNKVLETFLSEKGILHQSACFDTLEHDEIAECKNKHLLEVARAMMFYMNIPKYLWGDAILIHMMPTKVLQYATHLECLKKVFLKSRIDFELPLKIFGCTAYVHIPKRLRSKLDPRAEKCVFVGYTPNKKGYKCFNPLIKLYIWKMSYILQKIQFRGSSGTKILGNFRTFA